MDGFICGNLDDVSDGEKIVELGGQFHELEGLRAKGRK